MTTMASRTLLIAGNWKMHKTVAATRTLIAELRDRLDGDGSRGVDVAIAPPFTALGAAAAALAGSSIELWAQNMHAEDSGAFTGEVSPVMLTDIGADAVLLGHSERRAIFGETDVDVCRKLRAALAHDLRVTLCVGESEAQRKAGQTTDVVAAQVRGALEGLPSERSSHLVLAYEPVWAIGTGLTATPEQAQEVHAMIRGLLGEQLGARVADAIRIQYGGSVKPSNAKELMSQPDIDGALVGGASLDADSFVGIVRALA